jgi:transposase
MLLRNQARSVQHMQKALTQMNIQLANVISDVAGVTGQKIIRQIVAGQRDAQVLAEYRDARIKASEQEIAKSLQGNWRAEHLFALKQALAGFDFCVSQLAECDSESERVLQELHTHEGKPAKGKKRSRARNAPKFDVREHLFKVCGVDLTRIDGIDVSTALVVISEIGPDMGRFQSVKHFTSWLGLCPGTKISGGKALSRRTRHVVNRASTLLRLAALAAGRTDTWIGRFYRRKRSHLGAPKAITATAHKLACVIYHMLKYQEEYLPLDVIIYDAKAQEHRMRHLRKQAESLGFELIPRKEAA